MPSTMQQIYEQALNLPLESQEALAEKLVENIERHIDPNLEQTHLNTAKQRQEELASGNVQGIPGDEALKTVRDEFDS